MEKETAAVLEALYGLRGRTGLVTGGSRGLGLEIANLLAGAGAAVISLSRSGQAPNDSAGHPGVTHVAVDVTDEAGLRTVIEQVGATQGLDFLVHNAGITHRKALAEVTPAEWDRLQAVNVRAGYLACRLAYPYLKKSAHGGRVVFITSMGAHLGFEGVVPYCASKAALLGLVRGLAVEWAGDGILVNSVAPGWFASELTAGFMDEARRAKIIARIPLHRLSTLREVAGVVLFLLSPSASYITGQDIAVDGGTLAYGY